MSIIIFIIVLAVLIFVHELGHFLAAKMSGVRVDAFALGFPPKIVSFKPKGSETEYSINWIPFGGFVKIFGEDPDDESIEGPDKERSFVHKPKLVQIWILAAGVIFNVVFAWILISIGFMSGMQMPVTENTTGLVGDAHVTITNTLAESPAFDAELQAGDALLSLETTEASLSENDVTVESVQAFIKESNGNPIEVVYERGGESFETSVLATEGITPDAVAIGVGLDYLGVVRLNPFEALWEGGKFTVRVTGLVAVGLWDFLSNLVTGDADLSQVAGPVGIVGLVGQASQIGFVALLTFTAFISLNLAVLNLLPFPALDGGRILFVIIEFLKGSPIKPKVANTVNVIGFGLLILLMVVVTVSDVIKLF